MLEIIRPLVIGVGSSGTRHLNTQLEMGFKTGVFDINPMAKQGLENNTEVIKFEKLAEALSWANLVHVCTPDDQHTEFAAAALRERKAVLCEKPFTTNLQDALDLQRLSHEYETPLFVGHNYRLTPTFLETRKRVLAGQLGKVTWVEATYLHDMTEYQKLTPWRKSQDFLYGAGSHPLDLAMWVIDEDITAVQAVTGIKIRPGYEMPESYSISLIFRSGALGHVRLDASLARPYHGTDLIVDASEGQIASHNKIDLLTVYKRGDRKPSSVKVTNSGTFTIPAEIRLVDNYLLGRSPDSWPVPMVDEAVKVMQVLNAIKKAIEYQSTELV